ncbi:hypothetical protein CLOM_g8398 [Closterium sp. NIES-68]|nr:hypothetical protein CLOM_g8398 [Closterium sp. NIES-68]
MGEVSHVGASATEAARLQGGEAGRRGGGKASMQDARKEGLSEVPCYGRDGKGQQEVKDWHVALHERSDGSAGGLCIG